MRELEAVAYQLSNRRIDDLDALRKWLAVLVAPEHVLNIDDVDNRPTLMPGLKFREKRGPCMPSLLNGAGASGAGDGNICRHPTR